MRSPKRSPEPLPPGADHRGILHLTEPRADGRMPAGRRPTRGRQGRARGGTRL
ncbi:hypothetical protein PJI17_01205 [Mycobacterium kansasii]